MVVSGAEGWSKISSSGLTLIQNGEGDESLRMPVETTQCPRCKSTSVAHLQASIQWRCNQCSHQWDFASPQERALVPTHLAGGRAEQFLEKFLAVKAQIKSEAEKIWNDCSNVHQLIAVTSDNDKRRVFSEQFEIWRNRLIELQEILIGGCLLPLVIEYKIVENEQIWLQEACQEAWNPVTAGYLDWLTFVVRGSLHGAGTRAIPKWAWQLPSGPRDLVPVELAPEKKASGHFSSLEYRLQRDLDVHRKGAIAKAFLAGKITRSSIADNGKRRLETDAHHRPAPLVHDETNAEFVASPDYRTIVFRGKVYRLTRNQSEIVKLLHEAHERGTPAVGQDFLLSALEAETSRVRDSFKNSPLLGTLIIANKKPRGTYELNLK